MSKIRDETDFFGVLILSAGASRRMGSPKALLPWGNTFILKHLLTRWHSVGAAQVAVVFDPANTPIVAELDRLKLASRIPNPYAQSGGMISSLRAAASWTGWDSRLDRFAIALVDQPHVSNETLISLIVFSQENAGKICQPQFDNRRGHPVVLPRAVFFELAKTSAPNLRAFIHERTHLRAFLACPDASVLTDMDTPEEYRKVRHET